MASKERENLMDDFKQQLWELKVVISEVLNGSIGENQWLEPLVEFDGHIGGKSMETFSIGVWVHFPNGWLMIACQLSQRRTYSLKLSVGIKCLV